MEHVELVVEAGAVRVVLGTAALDGELIASVTALDAERVVVALDTRDGFVMVRGWVEKSARTISDLARELMEAGVRRFLHTDVERDGTLTAPNYASLQALISLGAPVIASGGVSSLADIERLKDIGAEAAIVGRALYEGSIELEEAMTVAG
jgi:phosphoribosylformimino-5-aminoimidazole carboxamide ribotide isomerase